MMFLCIFKSIRRDRDDIVLSLNVFVYCCGYLGNQYLYQYFGYHTDIDGASVVLHEKGNIHDTDRSFAQRGRVDIKIPIPIDQGGADKVFDVIKKMDIDSAPPSLLDKEELYLRQIFYHIDGNTYDDKIFALLQPLSQEKRIEILKEELQKITGKDFNKLKSYDFEGIYQQFDHGNKVKFRPDLIDNKNFTKFQDEYVLAHQLYGNKLTDDLERILNGGGLMAPTTDKLRRGFQWGGMSPTADMQSGGANYFFTRIKKREQLSIYNSYQLFFKPKNLARLDAISYDDDYYGKSGRDFIKRKRKSDISGFKKNSRKGNNETIFKKSLSILSDLEYILVKDNSERLEVIDLFKRHKITTLEDGRAVEDIVLTDHPKKRLY